MNGTAVKPFLNYLAISLWISSTDLTPEDITQFVGLEPTYTHVRGAVIPGRNIPRRSEFDVHEWQFREQFNAEPGTHLGQYTDEFITEFLSAIEPHAVEIKKLSESHSVTVSFTYHVDDPPFIGLTRDQIQAVAALGRKGRLRLDAREEFRRG